MNQSEALTMADRIVVMNRARWSRWALLSRSIAILSRCLWPTSFGRQYSQATVGCCGGKRHPRFSPWRRQHSPRVVCGLRGGGTTSTWQGGKGALDCAPRESVRLERGRPQWQCSATVVSEVFVGSHIEYEVELEDHSVLKAFTPFQAGMRCMGKGRSFGMD